MMPSETVRIPCSSARASQRIFGKLLTRVDPDAENGFGFEGILLRPGSTVRWEALWPTPEHPPIPVLLECCGPEHPARGHQRRQQAETYILWRFNPETRSWSELARSASENWTWALDLRAIAIRAIAESRGTEVQVFAGVREVLARICHVMDYGIESLPPPDRARAVAALHDEFCIRMTRLAPIDAGRTSERSLPG